jgi:hypothetical protein
MRVIDLDKLEAYFRTVNIQHLRTLSTGGISTLNMVAFIFSLKRFFEEKVSISVAGKDLELKLEDLTADKLLPIFLAAKKNYDNITIFFHFDQKPYSVVYMYDDDVAVWIKALTSASISRDYIFEARFIQQVCQDNGLELNPYSFDVLFRMYLKSQGS